MTVEYVEGPQWRDVPPLSDDAWLEQLPDSPHAEMIRQRRAEAAMSAKPHRERARFYRDRVDHPQLNPATQAGLAAYHAAMAILDG